MLEIGINILGATIETGLLAYIYHSFFAEYSRVSERKRIVSYSFIGVLLFTVSCLTLTTPQRMSLTLGIVLMPVCLYRKNLIVKIFIGILFWAIQLSCEFLTWTLLSLLTQNLQEPLDSHAIDNYIQGIFLSKSIAIFIVYFISAFKKNNKYYGHKKLLCAFVIVPFITTVSLNQLAYATALLQTESAHNMFLIVALFMVIANILLVYLFSKQMETEQIKRDLEMASLKAALQEQYYQQLIERDLKVSRINHDMKNHLTFMKYHLDNNNIELVKDYLTNLTESLAGTKVNYSGNQVIDAVLNMKVTEAAEAGVKLEVEISHKLEQLKIDDMDLVIILVNCLDNAIEAAKALKEMEPEIKLFISRNETGLAILVENPLEYEVDINNLKTTKNDDGHGYGIKNIRNIVEKYDGIYKLETSKNTFKAKIFIKT